jgi:tetratricopeptide (TPR) repeat protein
MRIPVLVALLSSSILALSNTAAAQPADAIAAGYQQLYAGDADEALRQFEALHTRDPQQLPAWFGQLMTAFARLQADDSGEAALERGLDEFIAAADARYARSHEDSEALFYLAHVTMLRSAYRLSEDKGVWGAARDAARAKGYAEQYLRTHPEHGDGYLTLGIYNYFVGIAPTFVKVLRVLLFLPGGNRAEGLKQIERAARDGALFAPLARGLLGSLYGTIEGRVPEAIDLGERLVRQYPGNGMARIALAQLYARPTVEAYSRAADHYRAVLDRPPSASLVHESERHAATLGLAALKRAQWQLDEAIALLKPAIDKAIEKPAWVLPTFLMQRANYRMLLNDKGAADDVRRVLGTARMAKWHKEARQDASTIDAWLRRSADAAVYASLIPGNRLVAEDRWDAARAFYQANAAGSADWQVRYRLAVLDFSRGEYGIATPALESIASTDARMPDWLRASALLHLAWTRDLAGRRSDALALYKRIVDDFDDESAAGPARLGLLAPYKGRATLPGLKPGPSSLY